MARQMSPELAQQLQAFQQRHPDFDPSTGFNPFGAVINYTRNGGADRNAIGEFMQLRSALDREGFHFNDQGSPQANRSWWQNALLAAAAVGAPLGGFAALGGFGGGAGAGAGGASFISNAVNGSANAALGAGAGGAAAGSGSLLSSILSGVGQGAGAAANSMANNRGAEAGLTLDANDAFERQLLAREVEKRNARSDALRTSIFGSLVSGYQAPTRPEGMPQSPYATMGAAGREAADFASQDALARLRAGDTLPALQRTDPAQFARPSIWERLLGYGGAAAGAFGRR